MTIFGEITNKRWDAFEFVNRSKKIEGGKYSNQKLKQIAHLVKGQSITSNNIIKGDYPVIAGGKTSPYSHNQFNFERNTVTISASGAYSGYVWYHNYPIFASDCTVVFSKEEDVVSTLFLAEILKLKQQEIYNLQQGAGQPHVYALATIFKSHDTRTFLFVEECYYPLFPLFIRWVCNAMHHFHPAS